VRIHHLAILTPDPAALAAFYRDTLGVPQTRVQEDADGVRSVWLNLDGTILMVERGARRDSHGAGLDGLLFAVEPGSAARWRVRLGDRMIGRTGFTIYARDPDGNRFGVSSYPEPLGD